MMNLKRFEKGFWMLQKIQRSRPKKHMNAKTHLFPSGGLALTPKHWQDLIGHHKYWCGCWLVPTANPFAKPVAAAPWTQQWSTPSNNLVKCFCPVYQCQNCTEQIAADQILVILSLIFTISTTEEHRKCNCMSIKNGPRTSNTQVANKKWKISSLFAKSNRLTHKCVRYKEWTLNCDQIDKRDFLHILHK